MYARLALGVVVVAGCGRFDFSARSDGGPSDGGPSAGDGGAVGDGPSAEARCAVAAPGVSAYDAIGAGTSASPYVLCDGAQLIALMAAPAAWSADFAVGSDLAPPAVGTAPIGDLATPYTGDFDGRGHAISGFVFDDPTRDQAGLFGVVSGPLARIHDLALVGANVTGHADTGLLVGRLAGGARVERTSTSGSAAAYGQYVGGSIGVVGAEWTVADSAGAFVSASSSSATVSNHTGANNNFAGGLIGTESNTSVVIDCDATGPVHAGLDFGGGLIGGTTGLVIDSFSTGAVIGVSSTGGLIGSCGGRVFNSFSTGDVTGGDLTTDSVLIGDLWGSDVVNTYAAASETCTASPSCDPEKGGEATVPDAQLADPAQQPLASWNFATWSVDGGVLHLAPALQDPAFECAAHTGDAPFAGGDGSPSSPYLICTAAQLAAIDGDLDAFHTFALMADLDLGGSPTAPIGSDASPFHGFVDGNGHTIANATVAGSATWTALFGAMYGYLRQLGVPNLAIEINGQAAGLVGDLLVGTIADCYVTGAISSNSPAAGGLAGYLEDSGGVVRSYFTGSVHAANGGGLVADDFSHQGPGNGLRASVVSADVAVTGGGGPIANSAIDASNAYDSSRGCGNCDNTNGTAISAALLFDPTQGPLATWDFTTIWQSHAPEPPTLIVH